MLEAYSKPQTFQEALCHEYPEENEGWCTSIQKEPEMSSITW